jgi:hypothetical protein
MYLALWGYAIYKGTIFPEGSDKVKIFLIPLRDIPLPIFHMVITLFAIRRGYRSKVYFILTAIIVFELGRTLFRLVNISPEEFNTNVETQRIVPSSLQKIY